MLYGNISDNIRKKIDKYLVEECKRKMLSHKTAISKKE